MVAVAIGAAAPAGFADRNHDVIILRDGGVKPGRLDRCSAQFCMLDGNAIPRESIRAIGLNGVRPPPPPPKDPAHDEIRLLDTSVHRSRLARIDAANVVTANATHARKRVAWVHLAQDPVAPRADRGPTDARQPPQARAPGASAVRQPPWFAPDDKCALRETTSTSWGVGFAYDASGKIVGALPDGQVTCGLGFEICGDHFFRQQVIARGEACPQRLHFSSAPRMLVCCEKWREAKRTRRPCDPLADADCDGVPNGADDHPLDATRK